MMATASDAYSKRVKERKEKKIKEKKRKENQRKEKKKKTVATSNEYIKYNSI